MECSALNGVSSYIPTLKVPGDLCGRRGRQIGGDFKKIVFSRHNRAANIGTLSKCDSMTCASSRQTKPQHGGAPTWRAIDKWLLPEREVSFLYVFTLSVFTCYPQILPSRQKVGDSDSEQAFSLHCIHMLVPSSSLELFTVLPAGPEEEALWR